jgi:hypothetical protein
MRYATFIKIAATQARGRYLRAGSNTDTRIINNSPAIIAESLHKYRNYQIFGDSNGLGPSSV